MPAVMILGNGSGALFGSSVEGMAELSEKLELVMLSREATKRKLGFGKLKDESRGKLNEELEREP